MAPRVQGTDNSQDETHETQDVTMVRGYLLTPIPIRATKKLFIEDTMDFYGISFVDMSPT